MLDGIESRLHIINIDVDLVGNANGHWMFNARVTFSVLDQMQCHR
jgi:hypothetical protein